MQNAILDLDLVPLSSRVLARPQYCCGVDFKFPMAIQNEDLARRIVVIQSKSEGLTAKVITISGVRGRSNERTIRDERTSGDLYRSFCKQLRCFEGRFRSQADKAEFFKNCISIKELLENRELGIVEDTGS